MWQGEADGGVHAVRIAINTAAWMKHWRRPQANRQARASTSCASGLTHRGGPKTGARLQDTQKRPFKRQQRTWGPPERACTREAAGSRDSRIVSRPQSHLTRSWCSYQTLPPPFHCRGVGSGDAGCHAASRLAQDHDRTRVVCRVLGLEVCVSQALQSVDRAPTFDLGRHGSVCQQVSAMHAGCGLRTPGTFDSIGRPAAPPARPAWQCVWTLA